jgi:hypothetical protein
MRELRSAILHVCGDRFTHPLMSASLLAEVVHDLRDQIFAEWVPLAAVEMCDEVAAFERDLDAKEFARHAGAGEVAKQLDRSPGTRGQPASAWLQPRNWSVFSDRERTDIVYQYTMLLAHVSLRQPTIGLSSELSQRIDRMLALSRRWENATGQLQHVSSGEMRVQASVVSPEDGQIASLAEQYRIFVFELQLSHWKHRFLLIRLQMVVVDARYFRPTLVQGMLGMPGRGGVMCSRVALCADSAADDAFPLTAEDRVALSSLHGTYREALSSTVHERLAFAVSAGASVTGTDMNAALLCAGSVLSALRDMGNPDRCPLDELKARELDRFDCVLLADAVLLYRLAVALGIAEDDEGASVPPWMPENIAELSEVASRMAVAPMESRSECLLARAFWLRRWPS